MTEGNEQDTKNLQLNDEDIEALSDKGDQDGVTQKKDDAVESFEIDTKEGKKSLTKEEASKYLNEYFNDLRPAYTQSRQELSNLKGEFEQFKAQSAQKRETTEETTLPEFDSEEERRLYLLEKRQAEQDKREQERDRQQQERNLQEFTVRTYQEIDKAVSEHEIGKTLTGDVLEGAKAAINATYIYKQGMSQERLSVTKIAKAYLDGIKKRDEAERDRFVKESREKMKSTRVQVGGGVPLPDKKDFKELTREQRIKMLAEQIGGSPEE